MGNSSEEGTNNVTINLTATNDDPTNAGSLPSDISVTEDVSSNVDLSAVDFSDVDAAAGSLMVTLTTSTGGDLTAAAGTGITLGGTPAALTVSGNLIDLNNYFNTASNITYLHGTAHTNGDNADTSQVNVNDNGNTGTGGGTDIDLGTVNVDISAVNDDPTNAGSLPSDISVTEDVSSNVDLSAVDFSDVDAAAGSLMVTLTTSTGGDLTAAAGTGITLGGTPAALTVSGNLIDLNNYFNTASNITYLHGTAHTNGDNADTIQVNVNDNGNTGTGGGTDIDLGTVNVDISAVNDDPANAGSLPSDISVTEDVSSIVDLSAVNFSDVDVAAGSLTVTLTTSTGGDLTAAAGTGITLGGTPTALTVSGNLTDLNNYFNTASNITYLHGTPGTNGNDADTIQVEISDNGNTGSGGGGNINLGTVNVDIGEMNDAPVVGAPGSALAATEQVNLNIHGTGFTVSDVDEAGAGATATLNVGEGAITVVAGDSGVTISGGNGTGTVTLSGTIAQLDNLLTGGGTGTIVYLNSSNTPSASTTFTATVNDVGNTGTDPGLTGDGSSEEGTNNVTINITATNDDPTNAGSLPSDISVTEDVSSNVDLSAVDFSDVDAAAGNLTVTLTTSTGGDLTGAAGTGITLGGTPMALTVSGNLTDLNNYFNTASNITYLHGTPGTNGDNADTIQVEISDNGNTGSGGGGTINLGTVNVDIGAINDEEVLTTNTGVTVDEGDTGTLITRLMLETTDVDNAATQLVYTVSSSPLSGTLRLSGGVLSGGATFTQADINAGLLTYDHNDTEIFVDSFSFSVDDGAGTVSGGSFGITINPINDNDPVISSDGGGGSAAVSVAENVTAATTVTAADADLPAQTLSYSIFGGSDAGRFNIDSVSGVLTFAAAPNFEAPTDADMDNQYDVIVEVSDGQGRTDQQTIQVTVTDVDEFDVSPIVDNDASPNQVSENSAPGTILGLTAFSSDLDGTSNTVTYTLDDDAGGLIQIDGSSGVVRTASAVDFEMTGASLSIVVRATSDDSSSTTRGFTIAVTDVNEAPVLLSAGPFAVNENSATGTVVGSVTSNDPDTGDTRFYSISGGNTGGAFTIDSATGQITVTNTGALNYETLNAFALTVQVADSAGLTDSTIVAINLSDINEVPTDIVITGGAVAENSENGTLVGTVNVTDPDAGDTATWNLIDSAAGRFAVDASTGAITVADSTRLDFETDDSHTITVRTTDSGGLNYSKTQTGRAFRVIYRE